MTARRRSHRAAPHADESGAPRPEQPNDTDASGGASDPITSRRNFMKFTGACAAALATTGTARASGADLDPDRMGVLVDLTVCVGCRRCEWACNEANDLPNEPLSAFDDASVFETRRRPTSTQLTVVNRGPADGEAGEPTHFKVQCMHCERPNCVSACLVGAMRKDPAGPVMYDASKCIGCRYCMVACPFQNVAYEYENALTPQVRKCTLCQQRTRDGGRPACVEMCPVEALLYAKRSDLLAVAHERIRRHPDRYVNHVYGEHEVGGTSWLYLSDRPFAELGFPTLGPDSPADLSETIQHGIFKGFAAPLLLGGLLLACRKVTMGGEQA
jgi:Fe-S-cluster-containing dehydrogenase component